MSRDDCVTGQTLQPVHVEIARGSEPQEWRVAVNVSTFEDCFGYLIASSDQHGLVTPTKLDYMVYGVVGRPVSGGGG